MKTNVINFEEARARLRPHETIVAREVSLGEWLQRVDGIDKELRHAMDAMDRAERVRFPDLSEEP